MISILANPSYLLPPLIAITITLGLIIVVSLWSQRNFGTALFCAFLASMLLWNLLIFGMRSSVDIYHALLWDRALSVLAPTTFLLYYHFTLVYTNNKGQGRILLASYLLLVVVAVLAPTDLLIKAMRVEWYGYAPIMGPASYFLFPFGLLLILGGVSNLLRRYRLSHSHEERNRLAYLAIAVVFPIVGGLLDGFTNLPPVGTWGNLAFCVLCTIAIVKYHLLDIRVVVRKSLVYLFVSLMIAVPYVSILLLLNHILRTRAEPWWVHAIIILLLAILLRPLYSWAQNFVDRLFYRDRYDYLKALQQFSQKAQSVTNLQELSSTLTQLVSGALRTSSTCLLLPSESDDGLIVVSSTGLGSPPSGVVLRGRSPLIKWLKLKQRILSSEELNIVPQLQSLSLREKNNLEQMEAKLYVPIQTSPAQLSGILVLGQKLSQQSYSSEDEQLLTALSSQMAIALENARLYNKSQQEIKERKQAEKALRESKELFEKTFTSQRDAILILDAKSPPTIMDCNPAAIEMFGYSRQEVLGHTTAFLHVDEAALRKFQGYLYPAVERRGFFFLPEFAMKRKNGTIFPTEHSIVALKDQQGKRIGWVSVVRDITERKQVEEREKKLQQELYESGRLAAIGELAAGVAHEINNPLTAILGFSQRVLRKSHNKNLTQDLERVSGEALRAAKIVQNLLTFARRRKPEKEDCDANDILQRALDLRAYELKASNIKVIVDLTPGLPKVRADSHQIQEVFLNIILNAEQAMVEAHHRGTLSIKTCQNKNYVQIVFSDDGPGIAKENLSRIFHPFFSTRADKGGTGLGLSICHGIVTEHSGKIHAKSRLGEGATFVVELPAATGETSKRKTAEKKFAKKADRYHRPILRIG
jgi:two-component system NtrC family sensor kinase